jgi:hypothetical protein
MATEKICGKIYNQNAFIFLFFILIFSPHPKNSSKELRYKVTIRMRKGIVGKRQDFAG